MKGTPYAAMIDPDAPPQRAGVLASLNLMANTLALLKPEVRGPRWSAADWADDREGWLFLTSRRQSASACSR